MRTNIRESFLHIMNNYLQSKSESFGGHTLGAFVRNHLPDEMNKLPFITDKYIVTGSVGQGNWAKVPWLAVLNTDITVSTQRGYYIVYLFSEDMNRLYLTLAQGVTETSREEIMEINNEIRQVVDMAPEVKKDDNIYLGESKRARDYQYSTAAYIEYNVENMPPESELVEDLRNMVSYYESYIEFKGHENRIHYKAADGTEEIYEEKLQVHPPSELVDHIYSYITDKGFYYEKEEVANLYLSLRTKPFVIISGISGTGKTKIVKWFAESVGATEENKQLAIIPVRPDWNDGSDLLGYVDIKGDFKQGQLTKIFLEAINNPRKPYFVLLDEMNLARVEHYFSDLLSVMESRSWDGNNIITSEIVDEQLIGRSLYLPSNVYIIGTVNMDETTHPFSKKVLDRANTIEFNRVKLDFFRFLEGSSNEIQPHEVSNDDFQSMYIHLKDVYYTHSDVVEFVTEELMKINEVLQPISAHVGYRVRDEISFYMAYNETGNLLTKETAFDNCILQKILPRISGSDSRVENVLKEFYKIFTNKQFSNIEDITSEDILNAKYPRSTEKVVEMIRRLGDDGFTSFWIS